MSVPESSNWKEDPSKVKGSVFELIDFKHLSTERLYEIKKSIDGIWIPNRSDVQMLLSAEKELIGRGEVLQIEPRIIHDGSEFIFKPNPPRKDSLNP